MSGLPAGRSRSPRHGASHYRGSRRRVEGYTLIEVVMAIGVLTAGAVGVMALQQATTRGNMSAREMTTGTQIAQRWVERLRRDRLNWVTSSSTVPVSPLLLVNTDYLTEVAAPGDAAPWFTPAPPPGNGESANFDFYGRDTTTATDMHYCTNVRLEWLYPGRALRADVRVWWVRRVSGANADGSAADLAGCAPGIDPDALTNDLRLSMSYTSTVLRYVARRDQ